MVTFATLDESDEATNLETIEAHKLAGITRMIVGKPYQAAEEWLLTIDMIARLAEEK